MIPASPRRKFGIKEGTRIEIEADERTQSIVLRPITRGYIQSLRGKHKGKGLMKAPGFEWGTGFYINSVPPEESPRFLREALVLGSAEGSSKIEIQTGV